MTNKNMVESVLSRVAGGVTIDYGWLTATINQEFGSNLTTDQVKRSMKGMRHVKRHGWGFSVKGRATGLLNQPKN